MKKSCCWASLLPSYTQRLFTVNVSLCLRHRCGFSGDWAARFQTAVIKHSCNKWSFETVILPIWLFTVVYLSSSHLCFTVTTNESSLHSTKTERVFEVNDVVNWIEWTVLPSRCNSWAGGQTCNTLRWRGVYTQDNKRAVRTHRAGHPGQTDPAHYSLNFEM